MSDKIRLPTEADIALWDKTINGGVVLEELRDICSAARLARELVPLVRRLLRCRAVDHNEYVRVTAQLHEIVDKVELEEGGGEV